MSNSKQSTKGEIDVEKLVEALKGDCLKKLMSERSKRKNLSLHDIANILVDHILSQLPHSPKDSSEWISVEDRLPEEPSPYAVEFFDVWVKNYRMPDVSFHEGKFKENIEDHDGDFSHYEEIEGVTHWRNEPQAPQGGR